MKALELLSQPLVLRLGWTLVHFVWQATLVAVIVAFALKCVKKQAASLRYAITGLALVLIVMLGVFTLTQVEVSATMPATTQHTVLVEQGIEAPVAASPVPEIPLSSVTAQPAWSWPVFKQHCIQLTETTLPVVVLVWFVGVIGFSLLHLGGWAKLYRIRQQLTRPVSSHLQQAAHEIARRLGVHRAFDLYESALVRVPTVIGHLKPVILLPASTMTGLPMDQIEIILAHELAHIKRHDYLINLLQTVVEILGFYHPAIWWLSRTLRQERENCCDDMVIKAFNNPVDYAKTLAHMAEIQCQQAPLAVAATGSSLVHRIERLVSIDRHDQRKPTWLASLLSLILIVAIAMPTALAFAARDRRHRPASDDVTATFNEWINAIVDNDTKAFEIIAHKVALHYGRESNEASLVKSLQDQAQRLQGYKGLHRLKIVSMDNKGDHFDALTSTVRDPQGVAGRLSIKISTKAKPFCISGAMRFITNTGTSYSIPQQVLINVVYFKAPKHFPLIEQLPDASGTIPFDIPAGFWDAVKCHPHVQIISSPQVLCHSGSSATIGIEGENPFETSMLSTVRKDRTTIDLEHAHNVFVDGEQINKQDRTTLPSDHALCLRLHTFSEKDQALYVVVQVKALKGGENGTKPKPVPVKPVSVRSPIEQAFNEWVQAMRGDSMALKAIAKKQSRLWDISEADLLDDLKRDAKALKIYADLGQFKIESYQQDGDRMTVKTPTIKHDESPEGYYTIIFDGLGDPIVTDGIHFVTALGKRYPLHPQTLTTIYQFDSPSELAQLKQHAGSLGISPADLQEMHKEVEEIPGITIRQMKILSNSGVSGRVETDSLAINLVNTVQCDRKTVSSDSTSTYRVENDVVNYHTYQCKALLKSRVAYIAGCRSIGNGLYQYTVIQPEILSSTSKTDPGRGPQTTSYPPLPKQYGLLSSVYICRVPNKWSVLEGLGVLSEGSHKAEMIDSDMLKVFLEKIEDEPSAELISSVITLCKDNEPYTISCDKIENTDIELEIKHHLHPTKALIRSELALNYTRTDPNERKSSTEIATTITTQPSKAFAMAPISDDSGKLIVAILYLEKISR
jgi:beta-lactamase regulating signal transducer with metallopeptidase domain